MATRTPSEISRIFFIFMSQARSESVFSTVYAIHRQAVPWIAGAGKHGGMGNYHPAGEVVRPEKSTDAILWTFLPF
jgi:hypothetical protein